MGCTPNPEAESACVGSPRRLLRQRSSHGRDQGTVLTSVSAISAASVMNFVRAVCAEGVQVW